MKLQKELDIEDYTNKKDLAFETESEIERPLCGASTLPSTVAIPTVQPSSSVTRMDNSCCDKSEAITRAQITRHPGTGLGISIAGGIGSSPFKDNDNVMSSHFFFDISIEIYQVRLLDGRLTSNPLFAGVWMELYASAICTAENCCYVRKDIRHLKWLSVCENSDQKGAAPAISEVDAGRLRNAEV